MKISEKNFVRLKGFLTAVTVAVVVLIVLSFFWVMSVPSGSMIPTYNIGDLLVIERYDRTVTRGETVVFEFNNGDNERYLVKRCVAVAGDTVSVHDGKLWINGVAQEEDYLNESYIQGEMAEITIPVGYFWAMGDNRNYSADSRVYGPFSVDSIYGKPAFVIGW